MPLDVSPKPDILEQWEMEESWFGGLGQHDACQVHQKHARPGEKAVGALVIFQATEVREVTADELRCFIRPGKTKGALYFQGSRPTRPRLRQRTYTSAPLQQNAGDKRESQRQLCGAATRQERRGL